MWYIIGIMFLYYLTKELYYHYRYKKFHVEEFLKNFK